MNKIPSVGIYFHYENNGYSNGLNKQKIEKYSDQIPGVRYIGNSHDLPPIDKNIFIEKLKGSRVSKLLIAGYDPGMVKPFFTRIMSESGLDPTNITLCNFRDYGIMGRADEQMAESLIYCAVMTVNPDEIINKVVKQKNQDTLVIGGGIAGIQASLEIANSNHKVSLLERTGTIGGHMAMFDKTFPTLDCAACILTPKMVDVGLHPNIDLMTYSEVKEVTGGPGNYKVKILKKARRVDLKTCIGCGICSEKCPAKASSEFDAGTTLRKAIYIPFPQAVPNKYLIDEKSCIYVTKGKCGVCAKVCPANAVRLDEQDQEIEITVGNIVVATGFKTFDAGKVANFGYGTFPNVLTSLELERLVNAAGPTGGNITQRTKDKKGNWIFTEEGAEPESVAIIHCVGSRDVNNHQYCSRVCCMYSLKLAHLVSEKLPDARITEYYIDIRAFGKGYEEFYERIKQEGIEMIRGRTAKIEERNGKLHLRSEDIINNKLIESEVDMVILAVGLEPREDAQSLAKMLGIDTNKDGWFEEANYLTDPTSTHSGGITIAGVCQGPKDIPDTVAQASAAACSVIQNLITKKNKTLDKTVLISLVEEYVNKLSEITEDQI
nr:CoB--CoM heterodisulfide reductase iron-sulfur subunit A family protein [Bacteroidota bacterium]